MPRGLSLKKKGPQSGKEQLSITSFFKNASENNPSPTKSSKEQNVTLQTTKRKASSPISSNRNKVITESICSRQDHSDEQRIPLIEILDSPSNSPPLIGLSDKELNGNTHSSAVNADTTIIVPKESTKCHHETDLMKPEKSPRKQEKSALKLTKNEMKMFKKIPLERQPRKNIKQFDKNYTSLNKNPTENSTDLVKTEKPFVEGKSTLTKSPEKAEKLSSTPINPKAPPNPQLNEIFSEYINNQIPNIQTEDTSILVHCSPNKSDTSLPRRSPRKLDCSSFLSLTTQEQVTQAVGSIEQKANQKKKTECTSSGETDTLFDDEWSLDDIKETLEIEDLDLSTWQRCEIVSVALLDHCSVVKLKDRTGKRATCFVEGIWNTLPLHAGVTVSVQAVRGASGGWLVNDEAGLLVMQPDVLLSSTAVVGAVFCRRKAVLQETFHGMHPANTAMTIGILVHELFQLSLKRRLCTVSKVQTAAADLLSTAATVRLLYDAGLSLAEAQHQLETFVPQVVRFVDERVVNQRVDGGNKSRKPDEWCGRIEQVLDIEENIVSPQLGLKGKIDVTLQVNIHNRKGGASESAPLELKTGRATMSAEHRGQLILYMMMMSLQAPGRPVSSGLLLYLRDMITLKVVKSGYPEQRDLLMLRNQLAQYLAPRDRNKPTRSQDSGVENNTESEGDQPCSESSGTTVLENLELPEPINHHACKKCEYLTLCSLYQWHTRSAALNPEHTLSGLRQEALGHLSAAHVQYFLRWTALLMLEDLESLTLNPLHHIWTVSPYERERRGRCVCELEVAGVQPSGDRFLHTFLRPPSAGAEAGVKERCSLNAGDYVVVSTQRKVWVAAGLITQLDTDMVCVAIERDLTQRNTADVRYHIDAYESRRLLGFNLTNLAALMDNDDNSQRLRELIIDGTPPEYEARLPREVSRVGAQLLRPLNPLQQRAVLRALAARHYTLVHGMPGSGKSQTVVVLVQMLVALGQKVLVTAHTHSAVDNVLERLPPEMRVLRLGATARVSPRLACRAEDALTARCRTPEELTALYDSMDVVGVTCLGAGHSLLTKRTFDVCIVDESTQVVQSTVLRPLMAARRFVLVGDPEQLPPLVRSALARKLGMDESLFARLRRSAAPVSLAAQYRMNARIVALANRFAYGDKLTCANRQVAEGHIAPHHQTLATAYTSSWPWLVDCLSPRADRSALLLDTGSTVAQQRAEPAEGEGRGAMSNAAEALVVLAIVKALLNAGIDPESVGVITPYRDQVALLKKCVANLQKSISPRRRSPRKHGNTTSGCAPNVEVNTVDQYQGRDKSVIIYSCCKTWDPETGGYTVKDSEILEDKRRLTVAITRAKHKLILIGDKKALRHYSTFGQLFRCLQELDSEEQTHSEISLQDPYDSLHKELGSFL